ncbi:hypothetical protein DOY81_004859, partial [Sarcophaga bullata]
TNVYGRLSDQKQKTLKTTQTNSKIHRLPPPQNSNISNCSQQHHAYQ